MGRIVGLAGLWWRWDPHGFVLGVESFVGGLVVDDVTPG